MADLSELRNAIDVLVAANPAELAGSDDLPELLTQLERLSAVVTRAVGSFDARGEWAADGARSSAAWISTRCRQPKAAVQRRVRVARELRHMPTAETAWLEGAVSEAHVVPLIAARTLAPDAYCRDEEMLVDQARTLRHHHFCRVVAYWRQLADADAVEDEAARDRDRRRVHLSAGLRGTGLLDGELDPLGYAIVDRTLKRIEKELFDADWAEARGRIGDPVTVDDLRRTPAQRRHDALVEMARRAEAAPVGGRLPDPLFVVLVDYETFAGRVCQLAEGTVVAPGALVPWLTEAQIERVVFGAQNRPINVGVRRRLFTGATRRAVEVRDQECFHEYCDVPAPDCEIDHIEPWAAGGLTVEANGRCACPFHNRQRSQRARSPDPP